MVEPNFQYDAYHSMTMNPQRLVKMMPGIKKLLSKYEFDSIAFRGLSGSILAMPIAMAVEKNLIVVRKPTDTSNHGCNRVMGDKDCQRYIIVDDFVSSGKTAQAVVDDVYTELSRTAECIGILEVCDLWSLWFESNPEMSIRSIAETSLTPARSVSPHIKARFTMSATAPSDRGW